jgi:hypothetical protein
MRYSFRVAKPRFIGEADFIFHAPKACFIPKQKGMRLHPFLFW